MNPTTKRTGDESVPSSMDFSILLPMKTFLEVPISSLTMEAPNGAFCMKPRHIDFVSAIRVGILSYVDLNAREFFVAHHEGWIVKCGRSVSFCTLDAVGDAPLGRLKDYIVERFHAQSEQEKKMHAILAHFELEFARHLRGVFNPSQRL